jgi:hypothetical protein
VSLRKVVYNRRHCLKANPWLRELPRFELSGMPRAHCRRSRRQRICTQVSINGGRPYSRLLNMSRLSIPTPNRGHRASRSVERPPRAPIAAASTTNRSPATRQSLRRGAPALLRQNAAVMLLEVRLKTVWNRSLTAIGYVNLDFHLDFREFNI